VTPSVVESAFESAWDAHTGYDCITLSTMAELALHKVHLRGKIAVDNYLPAPEDPTTAIVGSLTDPPRSNPDPAKSYETEALYDGHGGANNFEATLVDTYRHKTYYFPGGTDEVYNNPDNFLTIFANLGYNSSKFNPATGNDDLEDPAGIIYSYGGRAPSIHLH
jgi:hypothetical protein